MRCSVSLHQSATAMVERSLTISQQQTMGNNSFSETIYVVFTSRQNWGRGSSLNDALKNAQFKIGDSIVITVFRARSADVPIEVDFMGACHWQKSDAELRHASDAIDTTEWVSNESLRIVLTDINDSTVDGETAMCFADAFQRWVDLHRDQLPAGMAARFHRLYAEMVDAIYETHA